ncbi:hypothetical protein [Tenacibaculum sp. nBUS_03]|uniref:hypothetical protein n=1 Tax=Tenacibaculum sp. nBUS_03 TaxID=3395320 RepID=UPI003EBC4837
MSGLPQINIGDTTFDKIWAYYKNPGKIILTKKQNEKRERWLTLFTLRLNFHSRLQAINAYKDQQELLGNSISQQQLYKDMTFAERLFGEVHKSDRKASLVVLSEYAHKALLMAMKQKNPIAVTQALTKLEKYLEIDKEEASEFNAAKLEDKPDKYSLPKGVADQLSSFLEGGVGDFNNLTIEDVDYEEVKQDKNDEE